MAGDPNIPDLNSPDKEPDFDQLRRQFSMLSASDYDENGRVIIEPGCEGCPIAADIVDANESGEAAMFDPNERLSLARLLIEGVYRNCPGRAHNQVTGWRAVWRRINNTENPYVTKTRHLKPGTYYPCGLDRDTPVETPEIS